MISTYVYRMGLVDRQYSFSAAVGLFNSVVNFLSNDLKHQAFAKDIPLPEADELNWKGSHDEYLTAPLITCISALSSAH